jgi:hypothetical protein
VKILVQPALIKASCLAQGLLVEGVPLVIGWTASILDDVATQVAGAFYDAVSSGQTTVEIPIV